MDLLTHCNPLQTVAGHRASKSFLCHFSFGPQAAILEDLDSKRWEKSSVTTNWCVCIRALATATSEKTVILAHYLIRCACECVRAKNQCDDTFSKSLAAPVGSSSRTPGGPWSPVSDCRAPLLARSSTRISKTRAQARTHTPPPSQKRLSVGPSAGQSLFSLVLLLLLRLLLLVCVRA